MEWQKYRFYVVCFFSSENGTSSKRSWFQVSSPTFKQQEVIKNACCWYSTVCCYNCMV